jgi:hypothetical protein
MRSSLFRHALVVVPLALAVAAHAQGQKPGLWETKTTLRSPKMDEQMARMQGELEKMPPEQRQMVQSMMAKQGVGISGNTMTGRVCMTKEMVASGGVPQSDSNCQSKEVSRTATSIKYSYVCTGKNAGKGTGEVTFDSPTAYTMHTVSDQMVDGKPEHVEMNVAGNWVGDDCGSVKPIAIPAH